MAWPTRSKLLSIVKQTGIVSGTLYNLGGPAAGHTWLIKYVTFYNQNTATRRLYLVLTRGGNTYIVKTIDTISDGGDGVALNLVVEAGDIIGFSIAATYSHSATVGLFGALLG